MGDRTRKYHQEEIIDLGKSILGSNLAYNQLKAYQCLELAALSDALTSDNETASRWLVRYGFKAIFEFYRLLTRSSHSFDYLMKNGYQDWAAVCSVCRGDFKAEEWLTNNQRKHFLFLAKCIMDSGVLIKDDDWDDI